MSKASTKNLAIKHLYNELKDDASATDYSKDIDGLSPFMIDTISDHLSLIREVIVDYGKEAAKEALMKQIAEFKAAYGDEDLNLDEVDEFIEEKEAEEIANKKKMILRTIKQVQTRLLKAQTEGNESTVRKNRATLTLKGQDYIRLGGTQAEIDEAIAESTTKFNAE